MQVGAPPNQPQWHSHCQAAAREISVTGIAAPERKSQMSGTSCCGECHIAGGWLKALRLCPLGQGAGTRQQWHPAAPPKGMPPETSACRCPVPALSQPTPCHEPSEPSVQTNPEKTRQITTLQLKRLFFLNAFLSLPICCWIWDKGW